MSTNEMRKLIEQAAAISNDIKAAVKECLVKIGQPVYFDWGNSDAPSINSISFGDEVADSYITKIWYDGLIRVNLHAYYLCDDRENVDLAHECCVDWEDILCYLIPIVDDPSCEFIPEEDEQ